MPNAQPNSRPTSAPSGRPTFLQLFGLFGLVFLLGTLLSKLGLFNQQFNVGEGATFASALVIGLLAGTSSCIAVSGGLLLSSAAKFREMYGGADAGVAGVSTGAAGSGALAVGISSFRRMQPVIYFVGGRIASYALFGGLIALLGKSFTPSPKVTGALIILAALYMITMGLEMLHLAPKWLKRITPRMPKALAHKIFDAEDKAHPAMPAILGAATFFLPCGFTQSLQLYALTSGSFAVGAFVLAGFAVGTAPALVGLGYASTALKGKWNAFFFRFSGALVIVLGIWNVQNGLNVSGFAWPAGAANDPKASISAAGAASADKNVGYDGKRQIIQMQMTARPPYYAPSNVFTVRAGVPVRMQINGSGSGCRGLFQIPALGVRLPLNRSSNVVEFTPTRPGTYRFSCSMGMYPGTLRVSS